MLSQTGDTTPLDFLISAKKVVSQFLDTARVRSKIPEVTLEENSFPQPVNILLTRYPSVTSEGVIYGWKGLSQEIYKKIQGVCEAVAWQTLVNKETCV